MQLIHPYHGLSSLVERQDDGWTRVEWAEGGTTFYDPCGCALIKPSWVGKNCNPPGLQDLQVAHDGCGGLDMTWLAIGALGLYALFHKKNGAH